jgi:hypothetical protein
MPDDDLVLEGNVGVYRKVDLETWGDISVLVPFDSDLKSLGFALLGDLICSALAQGILRAYIHHEEHSRLMLLVGVKHGVLNVVGIFFESKFADGATATTTTARNFRDLPTEGIHRRICSWKGVYDLHHQHQTHLKELKPLHGAPVAMGDTLRAVAESIDSFSVRMNQ